MRRGRYRLRRIPHCVTMLWVNHVHTVPWLCPVSKRLRSEEISPGKDTFPRLFLFGGTCQISDQRIDSRDDQCIEDRVDQRVADRMRPLVNADEFVDRVSTREGKYHPSNDPRWNKENPFSFEPGCFHIGCLMFSVIA